MSKTGPITRVEQIPQLSEEEKGEYSEVTGKFAFRSNDYYQSLIDWSDPNDPIRRIVIPIKEELEEWGELDASDEKKYTRARGLEHKYQDTALLLVNDVCGAYCRFCFRKRLFMDGNDEATLDLSEGFTYIQEHGEISNVLLTGGDPLMMSTRRLEKVIETLAEIRHVSIIRIGTKIPAFNPARILDDSSLTDLFRRYTADARKIYIMLHFNHVRELTPEAVKAVNALQRAGTISVNQTPLIRGVNDDPLGLRDLFNKLSFIGVPSYYVFQCRPTLGNKAYSVPLEEAYQIFTEARAQCSGLAKRARFVMSHTTGKVEVVGLTEDHIWLAYHQAVDPDNASRFLAFKRNPEAYWLDDYYEYSEV